MMGALALSASLLIPLITGARADEPTPYPTPDAGPPDADTTPAADTTPDAGTPPDADTTPDADPGPSNNQVHIRSLSYGGTGCPAGTASASLSSDATAFHLIFDRFIASVGPGISLPESRKNCQVNILFHVPDGYTYALRSVDLHGYADLASGAKGMVKTSSYFQGQAPTASAWTTFTGPYQNNWQVHDEVDTASLIWAPCGIERSLNINVQVQIQKGTSAPGTTSFMTTEEERFDQHYDLLVRHCP